MSLNRISGGDIRPAVVSTQSVDRTIEGKSTVYEEEVPLLRYQSSGSGVEGAEGGDIPTPTFSSQSASDEPPKDGDLPLRASYVSRQIEKMAPLMEGKLYEGLVALRDRDPKAGELLKKMEKLRPLYDSLKKEDAEFGEMRLRPQDSYREDGVANSRRMGADDDFTGGGLTNRYKWEHRLQYWTTDSDGDGLSDLTEIWLSKNTDYKTDPTKFDSITPGLSDRLAIPSRVLKKAPTVTTGKKGAVTTTAADDDDPPVKPAGDKKPGKVDLFEGSLPIKKEGDWILYDVKGRKGTAQIPKKVGDKEVKQIFVTKDGDDAVIELKDKAGTLLQRIRLKGGKEAIESHDLEIALADNGQLIEGGGRIRGGKGNDMIKDNGEFKTTAHFEGGDGNDLLMASDKNKAELYGGKGDDILRGGALADFLDGGDGDDLLSVKGEGSTARGGDGDDVIVAQKSAGHYDIDGGEGTDLFTGLSDKSRVVGIELGPSDATEVTDILKNMVNTEKGVHLDEAKKALAKAQLAGPIAANAVKAVVLSYLNGKTKQVRASFGLDAGGSWRDGLPDLTGGSKPPPPKEKDPPEGDD